MPTDRAVAVIPARWASSRFPGKPLARIGGKPMIQWVVEKTRQARRVAEVLVATDDQRIYDAVAAFGGKPVMTAAHHPSGTDRIAEVAAGLECDVVVNVQGDEPLIPPGNIDLVIEPLLRDRAVAAATLMMRLRDMADVFDPHIAKVVVDQRGFALYFSRAPVPFDRDRWEGRLRTGQGPHGEPEHAVYKHIGIYAYTKKFLLEFPRLPKSRLEDVEKLEQLRLLENNVPLKVVETREDSIGVDRAGDVEKIERCLRG